MILNTSLNVNEPICESPENALEVFKNYGCSFTRWILTKKMFKISEIKQKFILSLFSISIFFLF